MTIIGRVARLLKSEVHGILDSLEEPHAALKQAIRDMEAEVAKNEEEKTVFDSQLEVCKAQLESRTQRNNELEHQVELSLESQNETLARSFVRKKLENQKHISLVNAQLKRLEEEGQQLARAIDERRERLDQVKEKLSLFASEAQAREANPNCRPTDEFSVSEEEVELAYLEESKKYTERAGATSV